MNALFHKGNIFVMPFLPYMLFEVLRAGGR
jgi:hypothetical protein